MLKDIVFDSINRGTLCPNIRPLQKKGMRFTL